MNNQTKSNINAAKLIGHDEAFLKKAGRVDKKNDPKWFTDMYEEQSSVDWFIALMYDAVIIKKTEKHMRIFDIFAETPQGAWDREQVYKKLISEHNVRFWTNGFAQNQWCWNYHEDEDFTICGTYPEAIAAAVNEVMK